MRTVYPRATPLALTTALLALAGCGQDPRSTKKPSPRPATEVEVRLRVLALASKEPQLCAGAHVRADDPLDEGERLAARLGDTARLKEIHAERGRRQATAETEWVECPGIIEPAVRRLTSSGKWVNTPARTDQRQLVAVRFRPDYWADYLNQEAGVHPDVATDSRMRMRTLLEDPAVVRNTLTGEAFLARPRLFLQCEECLKRSDAVQPWEFVRGDLGTMK